MEWGQPIFIWLLIVPAVALLASGLGAAKIARPGMSRVSVVGAHVQALQSIRRRRPWLLALALVLGIVALARPKWGAFEQSGVEPSREILIALDLSRSMRVEDVRPSRLDLAKRHVRAMLDAIEGERVGLVVFAGTGFMQVPLSSDYQILREFLPDLEPDYLPQGGTDYTGMLRAANDGFSQEKDADRTLFIFSDGESTTEGWRAELTRLQNRGVMIISLGVGTAEGGDVPDWDGRASARSRLELTTLRALAAGEAGIYRDVSGGLDVPALLAETVELGRKVRDAEREKLNEEDRYQWFLALGVVLGLAGLWRELGVRPRARAIVRAAAGASAQAKATAAAAAALPLVVAAAMVFGLPRVSAHQEEADGFSEMSAGEQLQWLAHHLAWHPRLEIDDLQQMAELTIAYGVQTFAQGNALEEGALRDALDAVAFGEERSPTYANWAELRAELNRLARRDGAVESTRPPEEPKEARDEEDAPSQTNGQGSQTTAADSIGEGGIAITDATLGELRKEAARINGAKPPAKKLQASPGQVDVSDTVQSDDPIRAILMRRYKEVTEEDSPGALYRALQGETTQGPAGGRDW